MKNIVWFLLFSLLISCTTNEKRAPEGVLVEARSFSEPVAQDELPEENLQQLLIDIHSSHKPFFALVEDIIDLEIEKAKPLRSGNTITIKIHEEKVVEFTENLESRLDRYGEVTVNANKISIRPRKLPNYNYVLLFFSGKASSSDYTTVLSLCRRAKWRIISEWELTHKGAIAIWSKKKVSYVKKALQKVLPNWSTSTNKHKIVLLPKGTTILFKIEDGSLWREVKLALSTRFDDMDIKYRESENTMNILTQDWQGSVTKLIKGILKEDRLLYRMKLSLDKNSKTITIQKK
ncbi:hypothetical protein [Candidatus Uabimicrobium sp. HlEnr_7]|uniref:hypothetical protein n=1 Tax=Candidatus Uabimicrobium helgolandensis TaxID=3095367 RepID=UPI00355660C3